MIEVILLLLIGFGLGAYTCYEFLSCNGYLRTKAERDKAERERDQEKGD